MEPDIAALATDIAALKQSMSRIESAILGDRTLGHVGVVDRMGAIDVIHDAIPGVHADMAVARTEGDKRAHDRIDALDKDIAIRFEALRDQIQELRQEVRTSKAYAVGAGAAGLALGGGSAWGIISAVGAG